MTEFIAKRDPKRCPSHPGAVLDDMIPATGMTKSAIAASLGISRQQLYDILHEAKPVSAKVAARISRAFGGSTNSWLNMQAAHDAWHAEREIAEEIERIPVLATAGSITSSSNPARGATSGRFLARDGAAMKRPPPRKRRAG
ncbi:MAG: HigA family addiction module antidote protein [Rhizobiales bacterium]|nr:HigA family addiction module antidote protein [Hyphomicrobiales bacterium]MBN9009977.1 HigA family addiction module antidote protein [Hyphomicrobiales bacterium]